MLTFTITILWIFFTSILSFPVSSFAITAEDKQKAIQTQSQIEIYQKTQLQQEEDQLRQKQLEKSSVSIELPEPQQFKDIKGDYLSFKIEKKKL